MASDANLSAILELARREMPDVPEDVWDRFADIVRFNYSSQKVYVDSGRRARIEAAAHLTAEADTAQLAKALGISVRHAWRIKRHR